MSQQMLNFRHHLAALIAATISLSDAQAIAEERIRLQPVYLTDTQSCLDVLDEFGWACDFYEGELWRHVYGNRYGGEDGYWGLARDIQTPSYRYDLDGDGLEDMIIKISYASCERGQAINNCSHYVLFGDQPATDGLRAIGFSGDGPVDLIVRDGVAGIFQENYPNTFSSIAEMRTKLLDAPLMTMDRR